jgi:hypothetical protein
MDEETIQNSIFTGRETLNELEKQNEILEFSETTLQEAEVISKQALHKVRGMTWWGSIINLFTFKTVDSKPKTKNVINSREEVRYDDNIDEMLDIALTMNKILKKNNDSLDRIEVKVEKLDDEFTSLKRRINDI